MEVERLKVRLDSAKSAASVPKKRKEAADEDVIPVFRSPKKVRGTANPGGRDEATELRMEIGLGFAGGGEVGESYLGDTFSGH